MHLLFQFIVRIAFFFLTEEVLVRRTRRHHDTTVSFKFQIVSSEPLISCARDTHRSKKVH